MIILSEALLRNNHSYILSEAIILSVGVCRRLRMHVEKSK
jgi:hypothetical protein